MKKTEARPDVLSTLLEAVAAYYKDKGDKTQAGVVFSCLSFDPPAFYASVARYPHDPFHKQIVCFVGGRSESLVFGNADAALAALARKWFALVKPPPVEDALAALGKVL